MLDVTEHFWPKIWSHFRPYCLSLHSLTVSFSSESQMIFSHIFRNFVGLLQDYFLSISVLMLIPFISYIAQGQCFKFLLWNEKLNLVPSKRKRYLKFHISWHDITQYLLREQRTGGGGVGQNRSRRFASLRFRPHRQLDREQPITFHPSFMWFGYFFQIQSHFVNAFKKRLQSISQANEMRCFLRSLCCTFTQRWCRGSERSKAIFTPAIVPSGRRAGTCP